MQLQPTTLVLAGPVLARLVLAGLLAGPFAYSQQLTILVTEGDPVAGVGNITRIDGVDIADDGSTLIEADTDNVDGDADTVTLLNGSLFSREGDPIGQPAGATLGSFDGIGIRPGGLTVSNLFLDGTTSGNDDSGLYLAGGLVVQEGDVSTAAGFTAGTTYRGFFDVDFVSDSTFLAVASMDDPSLPSTVDRALVLIEVDTLGNLVSETVVAKEGDVLAGQTEAVADFETGAEESAVDGQGNVMFTADLAGDTAVDRAIYLNQTLLAQEGSASPVAGRSWGSLSSVELDLNDVGDWVFKGNLDSSDTATDDVIVKNGAVLYRAGMSLPDIAPFTLTDFGSSAGVWLTASGDVIWFGDWDDPDTGRDEGLFLNDRLILQEGVTQIGGQTIIDLSDITEQIDVSPDGSRMLVEGEVAGATSDLDVVIQIVFEIGEEYCTNPANSTGQPTLLSLSGSEVVADNDLTLRTRNLPLNAFGFYIASLTPGFASGGGTVIGDLCMLGSIGRFVGPGQIQTSGSVGEFSLDVDLTMMPQPTGFVSVAAGETWHFQTWHRDTLPNGQPGSVFSSGTRLTFQ